MMTRRRSLATLLLSLAAAFGAAAVEIETVDVRLVDSRYHLHGESIIAAPAEFVFDVLMDYDNFHRLAGGIAESRYLDAEDAAFRLGYTRVNSCILFFCRQFEKVERIEAEQLHEIRTEALPERSDFRINRTRWVLQPLESGTRVTYIAEMEPDFWIPPLIGPWALKRKLRSSAEQIGARIEYLHSHGMSLSALAGSGS